MCQSSRGQVLRFQLRVLPYYLFNSIILQPTSRGRSLSHGYVFHPALRLAVTQSLSLVLKLKAALAQLQLHAVWRV